MHRPVRALFALALCSGCAGPAAPETTDPEPDARTPQTRVKRTPPEPRRDRARRSRSAASPKGGLGADARRQILSAHNDARADVGVGALRWSAAVAKTAQAWADELAANGCGLQHNPSKPYGENLYWSSAPRTGAEATASWVSEAAHYDARSNTCARGEVCGHYTQVVWRKSTTIGCGVATCGAAQVWVCNYDPPGNYVGERPF